MDNKSKLTKEEVIAKDDKLTSLSDDEDQDSEVKGEYESEPDDNESDESLSNDEKQKKPYIPERLKKEQIEKQKRKVTFMSSDDESEESDNDNPLKLKKDDNEKKEREEQLAQYFSNVKIDEIKEEKEKEIKEEKEKEIKEIPDEDEVKDETLEESLQRMQFEENLKQLLKYLDGVKFTISPQELSHLFKTYPSILRPEVAATFLTGSNVAAVHNMIAHGFKVDKRIEDYYNKMKEEVLDGLSDKEKKRLENYYEIPDKWIKENIKNDGAGVF